MSRLIKANIIRLFQNRFFILTILASIFMGVLCVIVGQRAVEIGMVSPEYNVIRYHLCKYINVIVVFAAVFSAYFWGTEYRDGVIRNKVLAGHGRTSIYFAAFLTNTVALCMMLAIHMLTVFAASVPFVGIWRIWSGKETVQYMVFPFVLMISMVAVFTLIAMVISVQTGSFLVSIAVILLSLCYGIRQINHVMDVKIWGTLHQKDMALFWVNFLPGGQMMRLFALDRCLPAVPEMMGFHVAAILGGSIMIILVTLGIGLLFFNKKDLK